MNRFPLCDAKMYVLQKLQLFYMERCCLGISSLFIDASVLAIFRSISCCLLGTDSYFKLLFYEKETLFDMQEVSVYRFHEHVPTFYEKGHS